MKEVKKKIKYKLHFTILVYVFSATILYFAFVAYDIFYFKNSNLLVKDINFDGSFTLEEKKVCFDLLLKVKPEYLETSKSITFYKDINKLGTNNGWERIGLNNDKYIKVLYQNDNYSSKWTHNMKDTLCHELLHNIIRVNNDEFFAYDITKTNICYKK